MYTNRKRRITVIIMGLIIALAVTAIFPSDMGKAYATGIAQNASAYGNNQGAYGGSPGNPLTFSLTHGANVLVVVSLSLNEHVGGTNVTSVTVGAASATLLRSVCASSTAYCTMMWYVFLSSSGTETVTVTENSAGDGSLFAVAMSFAGARRSAPFFEDTGTDTGYCGAQCSASVSVASGTSGRRIIQGVSRAGISSPTFTWGSGQTELDVATVQYQDWHGVSYKDTSGSTTMTLAMTDTIAFSWSSVATAILPASPPRKGAPSSTSPNSVTIHPIVIIAESTTLTAISDAQSYNSEAVVTITVHLTFTSDGTPLVDRSVQVAFGTASQTVTTDSGGLGTATFTAPTVTQDTQVQFTATFAGD